MIRYLRTSYAMLRSWDFNFVLRSESLEDRECLRNYKQKERECYGSWIEDGLGKRLEAE